jgi:hypothetical protein
MLILLCDSGSAARVERTLEMRVDKDTGAQVCLHEWPAFPRAAIRQGPVWVHFSHWRPCRTTGRLREGHPASPGPKQAFNR